MEPRPVVVPPNYRGSGKLLSDASSGSLLSHRAFGRAPGAATKEYSRYFEEPQRSDGPKEQDLSDPDDASVNKGTKPRW
jgi:hypothetical protein